MKLDTDKLYAMGFRPDENGTTWSETLLTVVEKPDRRSDRHGRQLVVCPADGACWLNEYDREGEITDIVGLPPARDLAWVAALLALVGPANYLADYREG